MQKSINVYLSESKVSLKCPPDTKVSELSDVFSDTANLLLLQAGLPSDTKLTKTTVPFIKDSDPTVSQLTNLAGSQSPVVIYETANQNISRKNLKKKEDESRELNKKLNEKNKLQERYEKDLAKLKEEHKNGIAKLQEQHRIEIGNLNKRIDTLEKRVNDLENSHKKEINKLRNEHGKAMSELEVKVNKLQEKISEHKTILDSHQKQLDSQQEQLDFLLEDHLRVNNIARRFLLQKTKEKIESITGTLFDNLTQNQVNDLGFTNKELGLIANGSIRKKGNKAAREFTESIVERAINQTKDGSKEALKHFFEFVFDSEYEEEWW